MTFAVQWMRCDANGDGATPIAGATSYSYLPTTDDVGGTLRLQAIATNSAGSTTALSDATAVVPGNRAGQRLTADDHRLEWPAPVRNARRMDGTAPIAYAVQWMRCAADGSNPVAIDGATSFSYTPTSDDLGHALRFQAAATNGAGSTTALSAPTPELSPAAPIMISPPTIAVTAARLKTATRGAWNGTAPFAFAVQWLRCDADGNNPVPIPGATSYAHAVVAADIGHTLRFKAVVTNPGGGSDATSDPTALITSLGTV